jgi:CheY-like chemotaxis protein
MSTPEGKRLVLLLDDAATIRSVAVVRLTRGGFEAKAAATIDELSALLTDHDPDVVLLDVMMPEVFGYDLVNFVRKMSQGKAKIVLLSSLEEQQLKQHAEQNGADGWVRKSNGLVDLAEKLGAVLADATSPKAE